MTPHTNPESTNDYFLALGRFIDKFAQVEKELLQLMRIFCRVPENIARAVFSGVRTDAATGYMTRVLTVQLLHPRVDQIIRKDVQYILPNWAISTQPAIQLFTTEPSLTKPDT
jgi:hypothetical protein